ncbi:MAG: hypothetical protein IJE43_19190 [Alphaproteobacteria bacterium]|nr:hypothetical protein [Alphaproteobacteria bacterium]
MKNFVRWLMREVHSVMRIMFKSEQGELTVAEVISADEIVKMELLLGDFKEVPDRAGVYFTTAIADACDKSEIFYEGIYLVTDRASSVKEMLKLLLSNGYLDCTQYSCHCIQNPSQQELYDFLLRM